MSERRPQRRSSRLNRVVTILQASEIDNDGGGYTTTWTPGATVAAEILGLSGRESVMGRAIEGITTYRLLIRWRDDVGQADQLRYGDLTLNIRSAVDPDGRRRDLLIVADDASVQPS